MPRWNAWLCRLGRPGNATAKFASSGRRGTPGVIAAIAPSATAIRTSRAQPSGSSASAKYSENAPMTARDQMREFVL